MAFYKKQFAKDRGVWYPQAVVTGQPVNTKTVADRLAQISTVSRADVVAVLAELAGVLADYMAQGKSVRLDGLGTFRYTLDTEGVAQEQDFDFWRQLKAVRVSFTPQREGIVTKGSTATRALVPAGIEWTEWAGPATDDATGGDDDTSGDDGDDDKQLG